MEAESRNIERKFRLMKDDEQDTKNKTGVDSRKAFTRRGAVKAAATAIIGTAAARRAKASERDEIANRLYPYSLNLARVNQLLATKETDTGPRQYLKLVDQVAQKLVADPALASTILSSVDGVMLVNLFNMNRETLEPLVGRLDGRTREGRIRKILHASEFFREVAGFDRSGLLEGTEEYSTIRLLSCNPEGVVHPDSSSSSSSSSGSTCGSCKPSSSWFLGCCIIHDWNWTAGMSGCSPCS
jgi:hypothetical protein